MTKYIMQNIIIISNENVFPCVNINISDSHSIHINNAIHSGHSSLFYIDNILSKYQSAR